MATRRCPKCKLLNPGSTTVCDCGWSFAEETMTEPRHLPSRSEPEDDRATRATRQIWIGALVLVLGILITGLTYGSAASSPTGGSYVVATGPMIFGIVMLVRGLINRGR